MDALNSRVNNPSDAENLGNLFVVFAEKPDYMAIFCGGDSQANETKLKATYEIIASLDPQWIGSPLARRIAICASKILTKEQSCYTVYVGESEFTCSRYLLSHGSKFFHCLINGSYLESKLSFCQLPEQDPGAFAIFYEFLEKGLMTNKSFEEWMPSQLELTSDQFENRMEWQDICKLLSLLSLADFLECDPMRKKIAYYIESYKSLLGKWIPENSFLLLVEQILKYGGDIHDYPTLFKNFPRIQALTMQAGKEGKVSLYLHEPTSSAVRYIELLGKRIDRISLDFNHRDPTSQTQENSVKICRLAEQFNIALEYEGSAIIIEESTL